MKEKTSLDHEVIQDEKYYGAPKGTLRESKRPRPYSSYVAFMCNLVDEEPTSFEEATKKKEWMDVMVKEYQYIVKNDV